MKKTTKSHSQIKIDQAGEKEGAIQEGKSLPYRYLFFILVAFFSGYFILGKFFNRGVDENQLKTKTIPESVRKIVGNQEAKVKVNNLKEQNGVYEFEMSLDTGGGNPSTFSSFITRDGKILFQSGIKLDLLAQKEIKGEQTQKKELTCNDLSKSESPRLTAYVVSNCPYGLQMQRVFKKALAELPQILPSLEIRYIGNIADGKVNSMHGEKEAQENLRQICLREEQKNKYWDYVSCYLKEGKSEDCLNSSKININSLNACIGDKNRGNKYAQVDFDLANKLSVGGSPTLILDDLQVVSEFNFGGRVPDAIREILCCASKTKPDFCQKQLSKGNIATSFSIPDEATGSVSTSGCGN